MLFNIVKLGASMALAFSALVVAAPTQGSVVKRSAPSCTDSDLIDAATSAMNGHRNAHGSPSFEWDDTLAQYAQTVSDTCQMVHSGGPYGENLYEVSPGIQGSWSDATNSAIFDWAKEIWLYDFQNPGFADSTGHATALLWRSTTKFGCAWTVCSGSAMFTCEFNDAVPNMAGEYQDNVFPYGTAIPS